MPLPLQTIFAASKRDVQYADERRSSTQTPSTFTLAGTLHMDLRDALRFETATATQLNVIAHKPGQAQTIRDWFPLTIAHLSHRVLYENLPIRVEPWCMQRQIQSNRGFHAQAHADENSRFSCQLPHSHHELRNTDREYLTLVKSSANQHAKHSCTAC